MSLLEFVLNLLYFKTNKFLFGSLWFIILIKNHQLSIPICIRLSLVWSTLKNHQMLLTTFWKSNKYFDNRLLLFIFFLNNSSLKLFGRKLQKALGKDSQVTIKYQRKTAQKFKFFHRIFQQKFNRNLINWNSFKYIKHLCDLCSRIDSFN
jgi:hypothetical protein